MKQGTLKWANEPKGFVRTIPHDFVMFFKLQLEGRQLWADARISYQQSVQILDCDSVELCRSVDRKGRLGRFLGLFGDIAFLSAEKELCCVLNERFRSFIRVDGLGTSRLCIREKGYVITYESNHLKVVIHRRPELRAEFVSDDGVSELASSAFMVYATTWQYLTMLSSSGS